MCTGYALCRLHLRSWKFPLSDNSAGRQHSLLSPLDCLSAKAGGAVNGGAYAPFILTVDCSGGLCYMHLFLSMLLSHLNKSYIIWNGHEGHIQVFRCNLRNFSLCSHFLSCLLYYIQPSSNSFGNFRLFAF